MYTLYNNYNRIFPYGRDKSPETGNFLGENLVDSYVGCKTFQTRQREKYLRKNSLLKLL